MAKARCGSIYDFTPAQVETRFEILARLLETYHLPTEAGPHRKADAGEFMLMHETEDGFHFKHRDTRNYLTVTRGQGESKIIVPVGGAFARGTFDVLVFEDEAPAFAQKRAFNGGSPEDE